MSGTDMACAVPGNLHYTIGDYDKAKELHERHLVGPLGGYAYLRISARTVACVRTCLPYCAMYMPYVHTLGPRPYRHTDGALLCYQECAKESGDVEGETAAYGGLGNVYYALQDLEQAEQMHSKHLEMSREAGDVAGEGRANGNLAVLYVNWCRHCCFGNLRTYGNLRGVIMTGIEAY
eukprot:175218-Rhodomonas_salina.2